jgi:hypothetical protein
MVARVSWRRAHVSREASRRRRNGRGEGGWTSPANGGGICGRRQTGEWQAAAAVRERGFGEGGESSMGFEAEGPGPGGV